MSEALDFKINAAEQKYSNMPLKKMVPQIQRLLSEQLCGYWKHKHNPLT